MRERKQKRSRRPLQLFLVICEGETEAEYVNLLRRHFRLPVAIKTRIAGNAITPRLVNQYIKELGVAEADCKVFFIYDGDVEQVSKKIMALPGVAIISNPCIELWFALHSIGINRHSSTEEIIKKLQGSNAIWSVYNKGCFSDAQRDWLLSHFLHASENSKLLVWPENPSTNMYLFIDALQAEKR